MRALIITLLYCCRYVESLISPFFAMLLFFVMRLHACRAAIFAMLLYYFTFFYYFLVAELFIRYDDIFADAALRHIQTVA